MRGKLILENGRVFDGEFFGAEKPAAGEVVFSTAMTGYVEALTDPSYFGQILVLTYPLVGNYGVPDSFFFQSAKIQVFGLIVACQSEFAVHYQSKKTLSKWLCENNVPGLSEIDTRALIQEIRKKGTMLGKIEFGKRKIDFYDPDEENLVSKVSLARPKFYRQKKAKKTICLVDCGCKKAIINAFLKRGLNIIAVPWNYQPFSFNFDGIVFSNGPGDPRKAKETIEIAKTAIAKKIPCLGICLGNQILSLAGGGKTYKLKFGHRSVNQPVSEFKTGRCFITSQNHGFAVDKKSLPVAWQTWFTNLNDGTCEGVISDDGLVMGVQFHPEGCPGPTETEFIFDQFVSRL